MNKMSQKFIQLHVELRTTLKELDQNHDDAETLGIRHPTHGDKQHRESRIGPLATFTLN